MRLILEIVLVALLPYHTIDQSYHTFLYQPLELDRYSDAAPVTYQHLRVKPSECQPGLEIIICNVSEIKRPKDKHCQSL